MPMLLIKSFYALCFRGEQEEFLDVVTGILQVFFINIYALLYSDDTLSIVTSLVPNKFDIILNILIQPF